jgi:hypothetical protein
MRKKSRATTGPASDSDTATFARSLIILGPKQSQIEIDEDLDGEL